METVSIIIPCYNEEKHIARCLDSIIANDYPKDLMEILVIDGMSTDNSRTILARYIEKYPFIRIVDNPKRIKPCALNIGIQSAKGDVIIRMDAHAVYYPNYISKSVQYIEQYKADNVGGIRRTLPGKETLMAKAIAYSISHPFAAGNATYRTGANEKRWVDTVFGGCYRRELFDKIGLFNEDLIRGQDREFNMRLTQTGGRILFSPDIICDYYARSDFKDFVRWIYFGGLTPFYISRLTGKRVLSWRNLVPLAFVLTLIVSLFLSIFSSAFLMIFLSVTFVYLAAALIASIPVVKKERDIRFLLAMPFVFAATHIAYGFGSLVGLFKPIKRGIVWSNV